MRKILVFAAVAILGLGQAADAAHEAPAAPSAAVPPAEEREWVGRYCTPAGCAGASEKSWSTAIGFGAAALGAGLLGRRRNPKGA